MEAQSDGRDSPSRLSAGFFFIAFTEIPPYLFQPVRMIAAVFIVAQIYYRIRPLQNLLLSTLFLRPDLDNSDVCFFAYLYFIRPWREPSMGMDEILCYGLLLCLMLLFQKVYKGRDGIRAMAGESWGSLSVFLFSALLCLWL